LRNGEIFGVVIIRYMWYNKILKSNNDFFKYESAENE